MASRQILPQVLASIEVIEAELLVAEAGELTPEQGAAVPAVRASLDRARAVASGDEVHGNRFSSWWRGTQIESAYLHLHAARVAMVDVYDDAALHAEIPRAVARVPGIGADAFTDLDPAAVRALLRIVVEDGYQATDLQHQRLRSFRNIILLAGAAVLLVMAVTLVVVRRDPGLLPLCFPQEAADTVACPSSNDAQGSTADDILVVALLGMLGGLLSAVFSLRNLRGTSAAYDAPVALAVLKSPLGALTAVMGLVLVHGEFIPGLSTLDSQGQILAYAFLFGAGQQIFTRLVDQKAQTILEGISPNDTAEPAVTTPPAPPPPPAPTGGTATAVVPVEVASGAPGTFDQPDPDDLEPPPENDDPVQDDGSDVDGDAPERDHT